MRKVRPCPVISKLDLSKGFHQVPVKPSDVPKIAFVGPWEKYEFLRMPFGLMGAPGVFQEVMDNVLSRCAECCSAYIDDVIIYSRTWSEHLVHVDKVLSAIQEAILTINPNKFEWGGKRMLYLGHILGSGQLSIPEARAKTMKEFVKPSTKKGLWSFLGSINYYRQFVPNISEYTARLIPATSKSAPGRLQWTKDMEAAFHH